MNFETIQNGSSVTPGDRDINEAELRESFFLSYVNEKLLENFEDVFWELPNMTEEKVVECRQALGVLDDELLNAFLAIPHEIAENRAAILSEKMDEVGVAEAIRDEAEKAHASGYRVAYHCSSTQQNPVKRAGGPESTWNIDGREPDHRDGDVGMAYYSMDLAHLYRSKKPNYIYLVRADVGANSTHKQDNHGAWGRAPRLDVITRIDFKEALSSVEDRVTAFRRQKTEN